MNRLTGSSFTGLSAVPLRRCSTKPVLTILALTFALSTAGCNRSSTPPPDDATLSQAVQSKLASDTSLSGESIQPSVLKGVATLDGSVSSDAARSLAANDVAEVAGIRTVVNNLTVTLSSSKPRRQKSPAHGQPQKPSAAVTPPQLISPRQSLGAPIERASSPESPRVPLLPAHTPPTASARTLTVPADTVLSIRTNQTLDSATTQEDDTFSGVLASDIVVEGVTVLAEGTPVSGRVDTVHEAAHFKGSSLLTVELTSIDRKGDPLQIATDSFSKAGTGRGKNTGEKVGGGAAVGAILGGIFGGGKGAAIGAAAGGGVGAGAQAITKGQQVQIPAETLIRFHLSNPVVVHAAADAHADSELQPRN